MSLKQLKSYRERRNQLRKFTWNHRGINYGEIKKAESDITPQNRDEKVTSKSRQMMLFPKFEVTAKPTKVMSSSPKEQSRAGKVTAKTPKVLSLALK